MSANAKRAPPGPSSSGVSRARRGVANSGHVLTTASAHARVSRRGATVSVHRTRPGPAFRSQVAVASSGSTGAAPPALGAQSGTAADAASVSATRCAKREPMVPAPKLLPVLAAVAVGGVATLVACDTPKAAPDAAPPPPTTASAQASASASAAPSYPMPERPVPKTSPTVGAGMPDEVQLKAISYMAAMRAPHPDDAPIDEAFAKDLQRKLGPIVLSMDTGHEKAKLNRVELVAAGRQIDLLMSAGCAAETPTRAAVQRAGVSYAALLSHGVLVIRCNDSRTQCLQSTRDTTDVLCTTAPRHK